MLAELEMYHGEKVVAHEHPLHKAVVRLEKLCIKRPPSSKMSFVLFNPAKGIWFELLWASRRDDGDKSIQYALLLSGLLEKWLVDISLKSYQGRGTIVGDAES